MLKTLGVKKLGIECLDHLDPTKMFLVKVGKIIGLILLLCHKRHNSFQNDHAHDHDKEHDQAHGDSPEYILSCDLHECQQRTQGCFEGDNEHNNKYVLYLSDIICTSCDQAGCTKGVYLEQRKAHHLVKYLIAYPLGNQARYHGCTISAENSDD